MKNKLISVIIVNWNGKKWLKRCLDSLESQTYQPLEIILVDNASSDDSVAFVKSNYPRVKLVISDKNLGFAGGNNLGIEKARGELILLINNDTWTDGDMVEILVKEMTKHNLDVIGPYEADYYTKALRAPYRSTIDPLGHSVYLPAQGDMYNSFYLTGVCLLFSRELYISTGGLDNSFFMYCEEVDWFWRLNALQKKFAYTNKTQVYHAIGGSQKQGIKYKTFLWRNQNTLQMLLKNYSWHTLLLLLPLYILQNILETIVFLFLLKPKIAGSYVEGWWFNLIILKKLMAKRQFVQHNRRINDLEIMRKMFLGPGKLNHLRYFLKRG